MLKKLRHVEIYGTLTIGTQLAKNILRNTGGKHFSFEIGYKEKKDKYYRQYPHFQHSSQHTQIPGRGV